MIQVWGVLTPDPYAECDGCGTPAPLFEVGAACSGEGAENYCEACLRRCASMLAQAPQRWAYGLPAEPAR